MKPFLHWLCFFGLLCSWHLPASELPEKPSVRVPDSKLLRSQEITGPWLFQLDQDRRGEKEKWFAPQLDRGSWKKVSVPSAWDFYDATMRGYEGVGWFAVAIPRKLIDDKLWQRVRFNRVHHKAKVWLNGHLLGENPVGYAPFEFAITPFLRAEDPQWLVLEIDNEQRWDWLPGTKIVEWVQYGGILEPVELLSTRKVYLSNLAIEAQPGSGGTEVSLKAEITNQSEDNSRAELNFSVRVQGKVFSSTQAVEIQRGKTKSFTARFQPENARLWTLEKPVLYDASTELTLNGKTLDRIADRFGVRKIETRGREILLNGQPIHIRGVNRYDEFYGRGPCVSEKEIYADLRRIKKLGANFVRMNYPQSPVHHRIMDELGLLCFEEVPLDWWRASWHPPVPAEFNNDKIIDAAELCLEAMIRRDRNHPCVTIWSVANECETADDMGIRAMERLLRKARSLDSTRLITYVTNGDVAKNKAFALADLVCVNMYYGLFDDRKAYRFSDMEKIVYEPTRNQLRVVSKIYPEKPLMLAEFGTMGISGIHGDTRFSEDYQAEYLKSVWRAVNDANISGSMIWDWADYRHRRDFLGPWNAYFGPFGLVNMQRIPKRSFFEIRELWKEK